MSRTPKVGSLGLSQSLISGSFVVLVVAYAAANIFLAFGITLILMALLLPSLYFRRIWLSRRVTLKLLAVASLIVTSIIFINLMLLETTPGLLGDTNVVTSKSHILALFGFIAYITGMIKQQTK